MSMFRQLWLAIITSTLLALIGSLVAATYSARAYLSEQLAMKNADNAAALALSLSQGKPDSVQIELTVAALFDSGHYELIRVTDPFGKVLVEKRATGNDNGVPGWFTALLPMTAAPGFAQLSDGWRQIGRIELISHSRFAYHALWNTVIEVTLALAVAGLVGGLLASLVLGRLRKPLRAVTDQAQAITERRFVTIDEPEVPELKQLASAMNSTVGRVKAMFDEETQRLDELRKQAVCDPLTGLYNRSHFDARLRETLADDNLLGGNLLLIRMAHLAENNRRLGRETTDHWVKSVASAIGVVASRYEDNVSARLNGADFAMLIPGARLPPGVAESLLADLVATGKRFVPDGPIIHIGAAYFKGKIDAARVMTDADTALAAAELRGINGVVEASHMTDQDLPLSSGDWGKRIHNAIDSGRVRLNDFPATDLNGRLIHVECPIRLMLDGSNDWLPAGRFLPMAERFELMPEIDLAALSLGMEKLASDLRLPGLAINFSGSSVQNDIFRRALLDRLRRQPQLASRLWLEVPEKGVLDHLEAYKSLVPPLKSLGCRLGIEHFGRRFSEIGSIYNLGLDYLKVDASFVMNIDQQVGNQAFLRGLPTIAHDIGIQVFAEGVSTVAELNTLRDLGFDGVTGPAILAPK